MYLLTVNYMRSKNCIGDFIKKTTYYVIVSVKTLHAVCIILHSFTEYNNHTSTTNCICISKAARNCFYVAL